MSPIEFAILGVGASGLVVLERGTVWHVRQRCGFSSAERLALALNVVAFAGFLPAVLFRSPIGLGVGVVVMIVGNAPRLLLRLTGGADEVCLVRRAIHDLIGSIGVDPLPPERVAELQARLKELDRFQSPATAPVVEATQTAVGLLLSGTPDRASIDRAYGVLDERLAAMRAQHPW
jgi:hypothetical protein